MCTRKSIKLLGLVVLVILIDQLSKFFLIDGLPFDEGGFLQKTCNQNIAWGIPVKGAFFYAIWTLALLLMLFLAKVHNWNMCLMIVIAAAISNFIDRIRHGCVVDFISIGTFPVFNLADVFITLGILLFFISIFKQAKR